MTDSTRVSSFLELVRVNKHLFDLDLEERMMKEFTNANRNWMPSLGKMAAVVLLCVTVVGVSVAATGGFSRILENFTGTVEFPNGDTMTVEDGKVLDAEGNVIGDVVIEIPAGEIPEDAGTLSELNVELTTD